MATPLLDRLRAALHEKYDVERELGRGGMAVVFLARDRTLDRFVAIKVLLPELATAEAAERFLREARILANLNHPNVVPVHSADEADGLFYYAMDYLEGETLAKRLEQGPLDATMAVKVVSDVLEALEAAHARGVVHRDIKPSNVILLGDRAILTDFGIAKPTDDGTALTATGHVVGTPAYMAPEQIDGRVTPRTDIYAIGMVLYEVVTGQRWVISSSPDQHLLAGVPRRFVPILRRALAWSPEDRWESAKALRGALEGRGARSRTKVIAAGAFAALGLAVTVWLIVRGAEERYDLAVLPVEVTGGVALSGEELARLVHYKLSQYEPIRLVPTRVSFPWSEHVGVLQRASDDLGAKYFASARLVPSGTGLDALLSIHEGTKPNPGRHRIQFDRVADLQEISDSLTLRLARVVLEEDLPDAPIWTVDPEALRNFVLAESDFQRGDLASAVRYYQAAVDIDPDFALAWWRWANAWRWIGSGAPLERDFAELLEEHGAALSDADSALIAAQLSPPGEERFSRYRETYWSYRQDDFVAFLYGEELFNRGPLWGFALDSATAVLAHAVKRNPYWALSYVHLIWANIRLGRSEEAGRWLNAYPEVTAGPEGLVDPQLLKLGYGLRFAPETETVQARFEALMSHPSRGSADTLILLARLAGGFDLPRAQVELGRAGVGKAGHPGLGGGAHLAQGLGLLALGRVEASIAQIDSAALYIGTDEARLQAAEWVAVLAALNLARLEEEHLPRARETLLSIARTDPTSDRRERAGWALVLEADARGAAEALPEDVRPADSTALGTFLTALRQADTGDVRDALATSAALLDLQAVTVPLRGSAESRAVLNDPFARSVLHLLRGEWLEQIGDREAAEREYLWYEATDTRGLPITDPLEPAELDWALGSVGRLRRGLNDVARGQKDSACRHLSRVEELWSSPGPGPGTSLLEAARAARSKACA